MTTKADRYGLSLDDTNALKGIAICAMLWHHLFVENPEYGTLPYSLAILGKICVCIFVFLSGYGLTIQFSKIFQNESSGKISQTIKFLLKRYTKFYFNYWVIFIISVPLGVFVFNRPLEIPYGSEADMPGYIIVDALGLLGMRSYNITWWFNRIILYLYAMFPFLYLGTKFKSTSIAIILLLFFHPEPILAKLLELDLALPSYAYVFVLGIFMARNSQFFGRVISKLNSKILLTVSILLTCFLCIARIKEIIPNLNQSMVDTLITIITCTTLIIFRQQTNQRITPLEFLGKHSMNMYLTHTFILGYFFSNFIYGFKYPILIFGILLGCSLLFSICLEFIKNKVGFYKLQNNIVDWISNLHLTK